MYFFDTFLRKADPLSAENASEGCSEKRWIYIRGKRIHTHICNCFLIPIYYNLSQKKSNELSHPGMKAKKISENVKNMVAAGDAIIQTPAAYEVRLKLPVQEILDKYKNNSDALTVFNSVSLEIPVEELENENNIDPPQYLLLVPTAKKSEFLSKTNVPDNETSFYAQYDSQNKRYVFSEMRDYFIKILEEKDGKADEEDSEFTLTPIDVVTDEDDEDSGSIYNSWYFYMMYGYYPQSSSSDAAVVDVKPAVERPSIVKLNLEDVKIRLYYRRMSVNN